MRRTSYQLGSLKRAKRKKGDVWEFRWREVQIDGSIRRKNIVIGNLDDYPNETAAKCAVDALRLEINQQTPQQLIRNISLETLVNHYRQHELPDVFNKTKPRSAASEEMDPSALGGFSSDRHEGCRRGEVAQDTLLSEDRDSPGQGEQGKNSQPYERALFSCNQVGMGGEESDQQCSAKRKASEGPKEAFHTFSAHGFELRGRRG